MIVLDTHALIWLTTANRKIGRRAGALIDEQWNFGAVAVSAISFWEVALLSSAGRVKLPDVAQWRLGRLANGLIELPLDGESAVRAAGLAGLPGDPAGRFIVATALAHHATLVTADERILGWAGKLDRFDART